jgi:hypothetical protein
MAERTLKKAKNPKRVAAGKKAWRAAHRGGRKMRRKGSRVKHASHRVSATLGKIAKALVILAPPIAVGVNGYLVSGGGKGTKVLNGLLGWQMCYTGMQPINGGADFIFETHYLPIGWAPPLILGGIQYGMKIVHASGNNPFRVLSSLG